ncbi:Pimeloyl-ACP methyl ester carboxylesterase [Lactobacillus bombicola]|uniref:Alpha/beta hydrolase n=1 Tax=Lactobacillus bombicola TaxID=1505723 RepID=A0A1I1RD88_9LACO|nr:alpha/beta hydrolase [Lactobacillus bombicola]MCO6528130.1 alpha/beta hydrolase [Lactobacillus sp.]RHW50587.1 alpha/beta hydrolase [Lactobacillus bombicola]RHW52903.1 alpha/beta hydrolase [Lactobacillus bombicola]RHW54695.1 alpha/beta hydrolase [Lactobacillus bombicola]SFD30098.1 Pimeloyl-ACP methyl ester carboxylesterase [Lactobacillus bombicola]
MIHQADLITNDGIRIHYYDTQLDKQPLLAIPGIGGSALLWEKALEQFQSKFRIIIIDPRNQGKSARTFQGQRISRHAADLAELIQKLDLSHIIGIGNSMGAANFWAYISIYGSDRLNALIDLDQPPKMINDSTWKFGFKDLTWANFPDYLKLDFGSGIYAQIDDAMFEKAHQFAQKYPYFPKSNYLCRINHAEQDWRDVLVNLKIPMLVLAGKNSPFFNYHFAYKMTELNSQISAKIIPECGHIIQAEQPNVMYEEVLNFLVEKEVT